MQMEDMHAKHMAGNKGHMMSQSEMGKMMGKMGKTKMGPNKKKMMKEVRRRKGGKGESMGGGE